MGAVNHCQHGTKLAAYYVLDVPAKEERQIYLRLTDDASKPSGDPFGGPFKSMFSSCLAEANDFYSKVTPQDLGPQQKLVSRQAYAGVSTYIAYNHMHVIICIIIYNIYIIPSS